MGRVRNLAILALGLLVAESVVWAKSPHRILKEDTATMKTAASADTAQGAAYGGTAAYTPAAVHSTGSVSNSLIPFTGFTPPPANASPDVMNQAIQNFMQYVGGVDAAGNPQGFPDWVNPSTVRGGQRAPGLPSITGRNLDPNCQGLNPDALEMMKKYLQDCGGNIQSRTGKVAITDFSTNRPVLYILNQDTLSCEGSTRVTFGVGSHASTPRAGNGYSSHMTPAGFHITKPHHGRLYQEWNSVGISGMGNENGSTAGRGVIIHPSNGHTLGCIGIPPSRFVAVKDAIAYGSVFLNYFPGQVGSSQRRCPLYKGSRSYSSTSASTSAAQADTGRR